MDVCLPSRRPAVGRRPTLTFAHRVEDSRRALYAVGAHTGCNRWARASALRLRSTDCHLRTRGGMRAGGLRSADSFAARDRRRAPGMDEAPARAEPGRRRYVRRAKPAGDANRSMYSTHIDQRFAARRRGVRSTPPSGPPASVRPATRRCGCGRTLPSPYAHGPSGRRDPAAHRAPCRPRVASIASGVGVHPTNARVWRRARPSGHTGTHAAGGSGTGRT